MKKLFNNSTKVGEIETSPQTKTKRKFFKTFSFSALAVLMGTAGIFAFAPLGASGNTLANANVSTETTTETGRLIVPQKDDPVIYTTESGLEIKFGMASTTALGGGNEKGASGKLTSGNLSGFPYFTTYVLPKHYTWVIIGKSTSGLSGSNWNVSYEYPIDYQQLSYWQTNKTASGSYEYFFNNIYETKTPAATAITNDNTLSDYSARDITSFTLSSSLFSSLKSNAEIPSGCVLCISNDNVATGAFATISISGSGGSSNPYRYRPGTLTMINALEGYYTNGSFGLSALKPKIVAIPSLTSKVADNKTLTQTNVHIFGLSRGNSGEKFAYSTYLTAAQLKLSSNWWLRSNAGGWSGEHGGSKWAYSINLNYINTSGVIANSSCSGNPSGGGSGWAPTAGYRPAFCLKIA